MSRVLGVIALGTVFAAATAASVFSAQGDAKHPVVILDTSMGPIAIELDQEKAPITVANFLQYVDAGFYDNLIFHRVIPGFMIQGGGFDAQMREKFEGQKGMIKNESDNGLTNAPGTIAMARTVNPNSAQNQFFINLEDNRRLDHYAGGYAVFGKVVDGMDVVKKIGKVPTADQGPHEAVPVDPVVIKTARRKAKS
jgi:cyclophilin family peptidyl-prolyl cis-trans isomerase